MTRDELIEVMARAICAANDPDGDENWYKPAATAALTALTALEAAGVRLVQVEATMEMTHAVWVTDLPPRGPTCMVTTQTRHDLES